MDILSLTLFALCLSVAFTNGANDVSKGIATLVGSGLASPRRAALWGAAWTAAGAFLAALGSAALLKVFSGQGILNVPMADPRFLLAVGLGAVGFLLLATRLGMPVST
ncbi:MAG: inorganic phosphate transporter, partial [Elusimicrobia bacterium]|nr:inorganic phosphate transporter [Elusimicrobiota bacterium]